MLPAMTRFIALVRAANVGGTGKLPMSTLKSLWIDAGFTSVTTYINSGNVLFSSRLREPGVRRALEARLEAHAGKPVPIAVRTADEMATVLASNPFKDASASRTVAIFLQEPPSSDTIQHVAGRGSERLALGVREIYVDYGAGMADSRLRFPALATGTARNMNTVARLVSMARGLKT